MKTFPLRTLLLVLALLPLQLSHAQPTLTWLMRDFPPLTIFDGPEKGHGAVDQMLAQLSKAMPQYQHVFLRVNRVRSIQMLKEPGLHCDPTLLWTQERESFAYFSIPAFATLSNGVIVRDRDLPLFTPYLQGEALDLAAVLASGKVQLGLVAGRSYGQVIDPLLEHAPTGALVPHYGNDATSNLLQMELAGRVEAFMGYWTEVHYLATQQGIPTEHLHYLPVAGDTHYKFTHIACSRSAEGHQAIELIDQQLQGLRQTALPGLYAKWLDEGERPRYLEDARQFFSGNKR